MASNYLRSSERGLFEEEMILQARKHCLSMLQLDGSTSKEYYTTIPPISDGKNSLRTYGPKAMSTSWATNTLGISDHSQTAVYANGLDDEDQEYLKQHQEIDQAQ